MSYFFLILFCSWIGNIQINIQHIIVGMYECSFVVFIKTNGPLGVILFWKLYANIERRKNIMKNVLWQNAAEAYSIKNSPNKRIENLIQEDTLEEQWGKIPFKNNSHSNLYMTSLSKTLLSLPLPLSSSSSSQETQVLCTKVAMRVITSACYFYYSPCENLILCF